MSADNKEYFHFTIGPVQGFVAQARRTRDFWAGSFILSWLSSVAMKAVMEQAGDNAIKFPMPDGDFMKALDTGVSDIKQGNVPNRFKAEVDAGFKPELVVNAVKNAWEGLAQAVWNHDFKPLNLEESGTKQIWDRQVTGFWDIQWALVEDDSTSNTLDRMKNWRTYLPPNEPGQKCMLMSGWQELSGVESPGKYKGSTNSSATFWATLRDQGKAGIKTDLREGEQLCALAYIKRRFSRVFNSSLIIEMQGEAAWAVKGWKLPSNVPSVQYLAAVPWLTKVLQKAAGDDSLGERIKAFHDVAFTLTGEHGESASNIKSITEAVGENSVFKQFAGLDGSVFFESVLSNPNAWDSEDFIDADLVLHELKKLRKAADIEPVSPFYAVLLMDGDQLGKQMSDALKQPGITAGLSEFTKGVDGIVHEHNGFLIYAGGDDVLAILPLEHALSCAAALRRFYNECFDKQNQSLSGGNQIVTSISAAIQYTHIKMPLGSVLSDAHDLLDNVAKDSRGRDAIACRVWKPGGLQIEWAMPWLEALDKSNPSRVVIESLADNFRASSSDSDSDQGQFASKFFYRIRERFDVLNPLKDKNGKTVKNDKKQAIGVFNHDGGFEKAVSLMAMEYLNSGESTVSDMQSARDVVRPLMEQCRYVVRTLEDSGAVNCVPENDKGFSADGALLVRFLANKGIER